MADLFLIPYVRSVWRMLAYRFGFGGRLCLFGAGAHTRWLLEVTKDLPRLPIVCILDDQSTQSELGGFPIRRPAEIDVEAIDLVLVSSDQWEDNLVQRCRALWSDRVEIMCLYEGLPPGPYDKTDDRIEAVARIDVLDPARPTSPLQVVIVSDQPRSREAKLGHALRSAGWRPVLLHRRPPSFDALQYFETVHSYTSAWDALGQAGRFAPVAFHLMINSDYRTADVFLRHRPGVVIVDSYDLIAGMYTEAFFEAHPAYVAEIPRERFCLEQADGVCSRSLEIDPLVERYGYRPPPRLFFPDGCWNTAEVRPREAVGELHVVHAGKVEIEKESVAAHAGNGHKLWLARALAEQGIHFHLYPSDERPAAEFDRAFREYRDLEQETPYFHLHRPVAADRIIEELARFDLALFIYNEYATPRAAPWTHSADKMRTGTSNKLYDFIDAGLPIVHNARADAHIAEVLNRHGVGVDVGDLPVSAWGQHLRNLDVRELRGRALQARTEYDVRRHADRLTEFYLELHQSRMNALKPLVPSKELSHAHGTGEREERRRPHRPALV